MTIVVTIISHPNNPIIDEGLLNQLSDQLNTSDQVELSNNSAYDFILKSDSDINNLPDILESNLQALEVDFAIQHLEGRRKKVLIADMDSTMIDQECIDELAAEVGIKDQVSQITAKAMNGEIEFESALRERVALLKGLPEDIYQKVIENRITIASGASTLVSTMKAHDNYCALVSGGFTLFTQEIAQRLGFDENRANILEIENGKLSGKVIEPVLGAEAKVDTLNDIAQAKSLTSTDFIAVGDGANDLPMLQLAGTGVALHAKPTVAAQAQIKIKHCDLTSLLYLQGYTKDEFVEQ